MTDSRRASNDGSQSRFDRSRTEGVKRLVRTAARVLLWGCVLLLLIRGALSMLHTESRVPTTISGATVTVTQPAPAEPAPAGRK